MKYLILASLLALGLIVSAQVPDYVPTDGLLAFYPLDGNAQDLGGGEFDGSLSDVEFEQSECNGGQHLVNMGNGVVNLPTEVVEFSEELTIAYRFRLNTNDDATMFRRGVGGEMHSVYNQFNDDNLYFSMKFATDSWHMASVALPSIGDWYSVVATYSAVEDSIKIFLNTGDSGAEPTPDAGLWNYNIPTQISRHIDGDVDDFAFWNRILTAEEREVYLKTCTVCADENACNFNETGECLYPNSCGECGGFEGCTDANACNYNSEATCSDGGCVYPPDIDLGEDVDTCEEEITLHAGVGYGNYVWSTGETSESIVVGESGVYEVTVDEYNQNSHSLSFDGADDYMDFPDIAPELYTDAFTIMAHVYLEDVTETDFYNILSTDDNSTGNLFQWGCRETDLLPQLYASNSAGGFTVYSSDTPLSSNQWCHIAISYSGSQSSSTIGELRFYTDGVETGVHSADIDMHASLTIVGHYLLDFPHNLGAREPWSGDLDDMQIWSFALSESEVLDYMNCPPSPGTDGVIAHWDFDEGQGDSVIDLSGNGFHGTLINGTAWSEELPPMVCAQQCSSSDSVLVDLFDYPCLCGDGTIWDETSGECVSVISSQNACGEGTEWDNQTETCIIVNPSDTNFDGCVSMTDLLDLLSVFGTCNEIPWSCGDPLEYQGYDYETVQIGEQCWFAENLRSENYLNGDAILSSLSGDEWSTVNVGAVATFGEGESNCYNYSPNGDACNESWALGEYGRLYNWHTTVDDRGLCPTDWHVSSDSDWLLLTEFLGGSFEAEMAMKTTTGWSNSGDGSNSSGFSGLPGGQRSNNLGNFNLSGTHGYWWSSSTEGMDAVGYYLSNLNEGLIRFAVDPRYGSSVRCIKDSE